MTINMHVEYQKSHGDYEIAVALNLAVGNRVGYVGVSKNHPLFGKVLKEDDFDIHGGLNFTGDWRDTIDPDHDKWWFGFDAGHLFDGRDFKAWGKYLKKHKIDNPAYERQKELNNKGWKIVTIDYMIDECKNLIKQLEENGSK